MRASLTDTFSKLGTVFIVDLFHNLDSAQVIELEADLYYLPGFITSVTPKILELVREICRSAPLMQMQTPSGKKMSVLSTSCGELGWVGDQMGYRYSNTHPQTGAPWPCMPPDLRLLARDAARLAKFPEFNPDSCLINVYSSDAKMALHQDKDETDFTQPIVSFSLGLSADFLFGGTQRSDKGFKITLNHGDVIVWGRSKRLNFHGIKSIASGTFTETRNHRINLTFRRAR